MLLKTPHIAFRGLFVLLAATMIAACSDIDLDFNYAPDPGIQEGSDLRKPSSAQRRVFVYMGLGYNNLSSYLSSDIEEIASNGLPGWKWQEDVLLIFSHKTAKYVDYSTPTSPTLTRIYCDWNGSVIRDTLLVFDDNTVSASAGTINEVLTYVKENFPAESYGMLLSSHGTGWAPACYCNSPSKFEGNISSGDYWSVQRKYPYIPKPFLEDLSVNGKPAVKSFGVQNESRYETIEIDITDLADAIPMKMDYIIFDACLMGGIEVAYELRKVCDKIVFSQTEILADGMDYKSLTQYLFNKEGTDLKGFSENFFRYYDSKTGDNRSATISLVDCSKLEQLASVCRGIFEANRDAITALSPGSSVQKYFRDSNLGWFYDMRDIIRKSGATQEQLTDFDNSLKQCIIYRSATSRFLELKINTHCGMSMYLPYPTRTYLNNFYKTLEWNKATGLVQ